MPYSLDLRERVMQWVETGGSITKAAKIYHISRATIYRWMGRADLRATKVKRRKRKLQWESLLQDVQQNPESKLVDRARKFGVKPSAISYALKEMKIGRKKKNYDIEKEIEKKGLNTIED